MQLRRPIALERAGWHPGLKVESSSSCASVTSALRAWKEQERLCPDLSVQGVSLSVQPSAESVRPVAAGRAGWRTGRSAQRQALCGVQRGGQGAGCGDAAQVHLRRPRVRVHGELAGACALWSFFLLIEVTLGRLLCGVLSHRRHLLVDRYWRHCKGSVECTERVCTQYGSSYRLQAGLSVRGWPQRFDSN